MRKTLVVLCVLSSIISVCKKSDSGGQESDVVVGPIAVQDLLLKFPEWAVSKDDYEPEMEFVEAIKSVEDSVSVWLFFGTWCSDSEREVPRYLKVLETANNPLISTKMIGVDREKNDGAGLAQQYDIQLVPTFIFMKKARELGRIIETPISTIEEDMASILKDNF